MSFLPAWQVGHVTAVGGDPADLFSLFEINDLSVSRKTGAAFAMGLATKQGVALVSGSTLKFLLCGLGFLMMAPVPATAADDDAFVAGVAPDRRPANAPRVMVSMHPQAWYVRAVSGVVAPYPQTLFFLDNQGDWYTPFNRPGMPGPYDIRGWHKSN